LAQIGQQASIKISTGPGAGTRISTQFAGAALEEGLRRLLRLASLSHLFLYAQGPGGSVVLAEVRVWGEGNEMSPRQATITAPGVPNHEPPASPPARRPRRPDPAVVEPVPPSTSDPEPGEPSEATRRVLDVFKLSKAMGRTPRRLRRLPDGTHAIKPGARKRRRGDPLSQQGKCSRATTALLRPPPTPARRGGPSATGHRGLPGDEAVGKPGHRSRPGDRWVVTTADRQGGP